MLARLHHRLRKGYFFGYVTGGGSEDMIFAVTGERPKVIGNAILDGYELHIQRLPEVASIGDNPREILQKAWGDEFKSYVLVEKDGSQVAGVLFRLSIRARHRLDTWELVELGWYKKVFVRVELIDNGRQYIAETQVLRSNQHARQVAPSAHKFWLMPKSKFLKLAQIERDREA
jgi:hypothetical protein